MKGTIQLSGFIKVGDPLHVQQLRKEGLIYCNTIRFFRENLKNDKERHDQREGATSSIVAKDLKIFIPGKTEPLPIKVTNAHINTYDENQLNTHLFCLFMISPDHATGQPFIDSRNMEFGKSALLINNPLEFMNRIKKALGEEPIFGPVTYYDEAIDHPRLNVFDKPDRFRHQNEFRIHIKGKPGNEPFQFNIGSIEDISQILDGNLLTKIRLERE